MGDAVVSDIGKLKCGVSVLTVFAQAVILGLTYIVVRWTALLIKVDVFG